MTALDTRAFHDRTGCRWLVLFRVLGWVKATCPDVILLDWELAGRERADLTSELRGRCPDLIIVGLSARREAARATAETGVDAFVSKVDPPERLLSVLAHLRFDPSTNG